MHETHQFRCHSGSAIYSNVKSVPAGSLGAESAWNVNNQPRIIVYLESGRDCCKLLEDLFSTVRQGHGFCIVPCGMAGLVGPGVEVSDSGLACIVADHATGEQLSWPCFQVLSGGTTGRPKKILRTQKSWIDTFDINMRALDIGPGDTYGIIGNLHHSIALYGTMEAMHAGADLHLMTGMRPDRQLDQIISNKVSVIYATPSQLRQLVSLSAENARAEVVRLILVGGSKMEASLRGSCSRLFPSARIIEFYGSSEASFISMTDSSEPEGSIGQAYPGVSIRIGIDDESASTRCHGEIFVKSPYLGFGYVDGSDDDKPVRFSVRKFDLDEDGYFPTGEIGWIDGGGNLYITGRKDRMYTVADANVHPEVIEDCLMKMEDIIDAYAYPVLDGKRGAVTNALILTRRSGLDQAAIMAACRKRLGPVVAPRNIQAFLSGKDFEQAMRPFGMRKG